MFLDFALKNNENSEENKNNFKDKKFIDNSKKNDLKNSYNDDSENETDDDCEDENDSDSEYEDNGNTSNNKLIESKFFNFIQQKFVLIFF